jgi:beta-lactam-binding protein with PASTA domain
VSVRFGVPAAPETDVDARELHLVHVPDVRMCSEPSAVAEIAAAGLVPGLRAPRPRPVSGRPEVVVRTHPRPGAAVRSGTRVDYELAPGEPTSPAVDVPDYRDHDAASTRNAVAAPTGGPRYGTVTQAASEGFVDYDTIETVHVLAAEEAAEPQR